MPPALITTHTYMHDIVLDAAHGIHWLVVWCILWSSTLEAQLQLSGTRAYIKNRVPGTWYVFVAGFWCSCVRGNERGLKYSYVHTSSSSPSSSSSSSSSVSARGGWFLRIPPPQTSNENTSTYVLVALLYFCDNILLITTWYIVHTWYQICQETALLRLDVHKLCLEMSWLVPHLPGVSVERSALLPLRSARFLAHLLLCTR